MATRLHLGCGERYLDGYVNIDYPPSEHTLQQTSPADVHADITRLEYDENSVDEIRLHHVFEHFDRPTALRLLIDWQRWLVPGGKLVLETPDVQRCMLAFVLHYKRDVALRHMFGSHEAAWAMHWDGWYGRRFRKTLTSLGFKIADVKRTRWHGTHNIIVTAEKAGPREREAQLAAARELLRGSLVDDSDSELRLLDDWAARVSG